MKNFSLAISFFFFRAVVKRPSFLQFTVKWYTWALAVQRKWIKQAWISLSMMMDLGLMFPNNSCMICKRKKKSEVVEGKNTHKRITYCLFFTYTNIANWNVILLFTISTHLITTTIAMSGECTINNLLSNEWKTYSFFFIGISLPLEIVHIYIYIYIWKYTHAHTHTHMKLCQTCWWNVFSGSILRNTPANQFANYKDHMKVMDALSVAASIFNTPLPTNFLLLETAFPLML